MFNSALIHKILYRFFTGYGYALCFIGCLFLFAGYSIFSQTNTSGIRISTDGTRMICDERIIVYDVENTQTFLKNLSEYNDISFQEMICTVDSVYKKTPQDKEALLNFVKQKNNVLASSQTRY